MLGQQERMIAGDDTWNMPMPYDKLAVRYRRWRNMVSVLVLSFCSKFFYFLLWNGGLRFVGCRVVNMVSFLPVPVSAQ